MYQQSSRMEISSIDADGLKTIFDVIQTGPFNLIMDVNGGKYRKCF